MIFQLQVLFSPVVFLKQAQSAIPSDAMGHVHHEVAFAELEKAVDRPRLTPPRGAGQVLPLKQLGRAHQGDPLRHNAEAGFHVSDDETQRSGRRPACLTCPICSSRAGCRYVPARRKQLAQSLTLRLGLTNDEYFVARTDLFQLVANFADLAAEPLDRFELEMRRSFHRPRGYARSRD